MIPVAEVLAPVAIDTLYTYVIPPDLSIQAGDFVEVALGSRRTIGVVWKTSAQAAQGESGRMLKPILARRDLPPLNEKLRRFIDWVAHWTLSPHGMTLRMAINAAPASQAEKPRIGYRATGIALERATPARQRALTVGAERILTKAALAAAADCSPGVIDGLMQCGALEAVDLPSSAPPAPRTDFHRPALEPSQQAAANVLRAAVAANDYCAVLLEGVTGSGKTEVYFEAAAAALQEGGQVLILLPEIALTAQFLRRFEQRFGAAPTEWHSALSEARRGKIWLSVAKGEARVVIGARSALFLPFANLRLIIVDEEHDGSYKQEEGVCYNARDMAVVRAHIEKAPVILASATPSLETRLNAELGRYAHVALADRFAGRALPVVSAIDLRQAKLQAGVWISPILRRATEEALSAGAQALYFLNRRGYAPLTLCRACGHRFQCPNCSTWLVDHRRRNALMCHHCGFAQARPRACPECETVDSLFPCGPGIERLTEETQNLFPDARILTLSSDMAGGTKQLQIELEAIAQGAADIVIGTQLVAKGHNFPRLSLVGVIDADIGAGSGDPRAGERCFHLLQQATGRAGRGDFPGRAFLQSWNPAQSVIRALTSGDKERFYAEETQLRRMAHLPPFSRLAALIVSAGERIAAESYAREIARASETLRDRFKIAPVGDLAREDEISLLGPAEAPLALVRGQHRFRLLVKAPRSADLQAFLRALLAAAPRKKGDLRVAVDVDPISFL